MDSRSKTAKPLVESKRSGARLHFIEERGCEELIQALYDGRVSLYTAECIAHISKDLQLQELRRRPAPKVTATFRRKNRKVIQFPEQAEKEAAQKAAEEVLEQEKTTTLLKS